MVECFVVTVVVGVLFGGTELTNVFTGSVLVAVLLNLCGVESFIDVDLLFVARVLLSKTELLCDSIVVAVENKPIKVLVRPVLNTVITLWWV